MSKIWMKYILLCMVGLYVTACQQEDITAMKNTNLTLQISISSQETDSRAESQGKDELNENKLTKVDCFFYPITDGGTSDAVYSILNYSLEQTSSAVISASLKDEDIERIYPNGATTCVVYMIANLPDNVHLPDKTDIASLKELVVETDFGKSEMGRQQVDFLMDGQSNVALNVATTGKKKVAGNVDLYRAASKVELVVMGVEDKIVDGTVTWKSDPSRMYLRIHNGVSKTNVGIGNSVEKLSSDYFTTEYEHLVEVEETYTSVMPYYSYASEWAEDDEHEVYFTLVLPWAKIETDAEGNEVIGTYRTCYYQIPVNFSEKKLDRNTHYLLKLEVGILGSFDDPDAPEQPEIPTGVVLNPSYLIVPWSDRIDMNAQLDRPTYLVVDKNYAEMNNVPTISIGYASSHSITSVKVDKVEYYNYQNAATKKVTITPEKKSAIKVKDGTSITAPNDKIEYGTFVASFNENSQTLTFTNQTNANTFYTIQEIYLTITNKAGLSEQIVLKWYPPIYFEAYLSNGYVFSNGNTYSKSNNSSDYVSNYDYYYIRNDKNERFGSITNPDYVRKETSNNNENQYNIYITALPSGSNLQIGDPREVQGGSIDGLEEITNYRKTRKDAVNIVAPIFKIASSFGKTSQHSYELSQQRCASYQENGYPAGRWRMPTAGEFEFIKARSANGDIPSLFADSYWTANGNNTNLGNYNGDMSVRCVYDVWYWGDEKVSDPTKPYWGDNGLKTHAEAQP